MQPRADPAGADPTSEADEATGKRGEMLRARARFAPLVSFARRMVDLQVSEGEGGCGSQWEQLRFEEYFGGEVADGGRAHAPAMLHCVGHEVLSKTFTHLLQSWQSVCFFQPRQPKQPHCKPSAATISFPSNAGFHFQLFRGLRIAGRQR